MQTSIADFQKYVFAIFADRIILIDTRDILRPWEALRKSGLPLGPGAVLCPAIREMPLEEGLALVNPSAL